MKGRKRTKSKREKYVQGELQFERPSWGGRRKGAGRKKSADSGVPHLERAEVDGNTPVHVTMSMRGGLPNLRENESFFVLLECFEAAQREDFRIVHFSVQGNHLHLLVEAEGTKALSSGMSGLATRIARRLNRRWNRKGSVFADRYHTHVLRTPTEVRNALEYIFKNREKHLGTGEELGVDRRSSAPLFDGWEEFEGAELIGPYRPVVPARSWLVQVGWRRSRGKLRLFEKDRSSRKVAGFKPRWKRRARNTGVAQ